MRAIREQMAELAPDPVELQAVDEALTLVLDL